MLPLPRTTALSGAVDRGTVSVVAGAVVTAAGALALTLPIALARTHLTPDAVNYLAAANALAHHAGFVDPVQWHGYLAGGPPQPAWAILSPAICVLLAIPIAAGASFATTVALHCAFAACVAGVVVVVGSRFMSVPGAVAAAIGLTWTIRYVQVSYMVLTEPTALLAIVAVIGTAPLVRRSHKGALACALVTVAGWTARPNVLLLAVAIALAVGGAIAWRANPRDALRAIAGERRLWTYLGVVAVVVVVARLLYARATGVMPYANYAAFFEQLSSQDLVLVDKQYVGPRAFAAAHAAAVVHQWRAFALHVAHELFASSSCHFAGLLLPVVATWGVLGKSTKPDDTSRRVAALGALGFLVTTILTYGGYEPRYVLPGAACLWLAGVASLEELAVLARRRFAPVIIVVVVAGVFAVTTLPDIGTRAWRNGQSFIRNHGHTRLAYLDDVDPQLRALCRAMDPRFVAVAEKAEALHFWCGNPVMRLPFDAGKPGRLARFTSERQVRYLVVAKAGARWNAVRSSTLLENKLATKDFEVFEVIANKDARPKWRRAPPSLACLGSSSDVRSATCRKR